MILVYVYLKISVISLKSFYELSSSVSNVIVILRFLFLYYSFFFLLDFSKTPGRLIMKFSGMVYIDLAWPKNFFRMMTSLPAWDIDDFLILRVSFCDEMISETTQSIFFKF